MPRRQLVLIGGSAGWMLPTEWLIQFEEVHAWDIDPLAAPLFRWRHGQALKREGTRLNLHTGDGLAQLDELTRTIPTAFFWFDNVLGQLRFTDPSPDAVEQRLNHLQRQLKTVAWGSVHDRMSGPHTPGTHFSVARHSVAGLAMETLEGQSWLLQMGAISPWLDHLTEGVLPKGTPVQYTAWPFKPRYAHWLEMGWTGPS